MQFVEMVGASLYDETRYGCTFMFGNIKCRTPPDSYNIIGSALHIKQYVVKAHLRKDWRGETTDKWQTAHPIDESVLADITKAKAAIEQVAIAFQQVIQETTTELPNTITNLKFTIAEALRVLEHGIGNATELYLAAEYNRKKRGE